MSDSTPGEAALDAPPEPGAPEVPLLSAARPLSTPPRRRSSFLFFGVVAAVTLLLDISSKAWAEVSLTARPAHDPAIQVIKDHLNLTLAYNKGGAWGLLQDSSEMIRLPFFLAVSVLAVLFIVSLYGKLAPSQHALRWGLPLVLGGALGNLSDRITRSSVIDFIDYRADWVLSMNHLVAKVAKGWTLTDHWPTFNVADIAICIGVGLMAVDMFTSRRGQVPSTPAPLSSVSPPPAT
jgi:signal peptidase II